MTWGYARPCKGQLQYYANNCKISKTSTARQISVVTLVSVESQQRCAQRSSSSRTT
jgi:hypothetical protein